MIATYTSVVPEKLADAPLNALNIAVDSSFALSSPSTVWSKGQGTHKHEPAPTGEPSDFRAQAESAGYDGYVLAVDDDLAIREALHDLLIDGGYAVVEAVDGNEALAYLRTTRERYVVLLDYIMPRMNGLEVLRIVAADPLLAQKHAFILISANISVPTGELATLLAQLNIPVLPKPFQVPTLFEAIEQAMQRLSSV